MLPVNATPLEQVQGLVETPDDLALLTDEELAMYEGDKAQNAPQDDGYVHYKNLAKGMDDKKLTRMAQDLIELVEEDDRSRKDWFDRVEKGIKLLGVSPETVGGANFKGASKVVHPLLTEAITQFQARAIQEMWPPAGPVHAKVLGNSTPDKEAQARRIRDYLNYQYTEVMEGAFEEEDRMLFRLPLSGSVFKKTYYDVLADKFCSKMIEPSDFIIAYASNDMMSSPRYTHRFRENHNDWLKKIENGFYIDTRKGPTDNGYEHNEEADKPKIITTIDKTEGRDHTSSDNDRHTIYEVYADYDLKDVNDQNNGRRVKMPYIITVDRDTQKVLRIQRNWKPDDVKQNKRMYFTHYKFTPGLGFYGYGFLHLIGGLAESATGSLRALLDSAQFANMQGGYRSRDGRTPGGAQPIAPGEWREVNSSFEDLKKAFFPLPYKEPSSTLFNLLGYLDEKAKYLAGITETTTGEANPTNSPVGTTAMLLEQGTKVFSAIHKRLHEAHKREFKILAELVYEYMPDQGYPYMFAESEGTLLPQDFDGRVDIVPVSDPNIASQAQRVAKAQAVIQMYEQFPEVISSREAVKSMLIALNIDNVDALIGTEEDYQAEQEEQAKMKEYEDQMRQLEKQRLESEIYKNEVDAKRLLNMGVDTSVKATQAAVETATMVVQDPTVLPVADSILDSSGFEDKDGGELTDSPNEMKNVDPMNLPMQEEIPPQESLPPDPTLDDGMPQQLPPEIPEIPPSQ